MTHYSTSEHSHYARQSSALISLILTLAPPAYLLVLISLYSVDVPFLDEWEYMLILPKSYEGTLSLTDLFALHNEHRLLFPRLIMLGLARLTHWNMRAETGAALVFAAAAFLVLLQMMRQRLQTGRPAFWVLLPVFSAVYFSLSQWQNWFMPCQFLMFFNLLAVAGAIALLTRPSLEWGAFSGALALAVMASYSFANGLSIWIIGLVCIILADAPQKKPFALIWCAVGALTIGLYFHGYHSPQYHPSPWNTLRQPGAFLIYVLRYLGAPVVDYNGTGAAVAGAVALGILAGCSMSLISRPRLALPFWGLAMYAISGAIITGVGRLGFGIDQATSSRYITVGNLIWFADIAMLAVLWQASDRPRIARHGLAAAAAAMLALSAANSMYGTLKWTERYDFRLPARAELISGGVNEDLLQRLHPNPRIVIERRELLKKYRLGVFR